MVCFFASGTSAWAVKDWTFSMPSGSTGTFTASEAQNSVSISGSIVRQSNNFIRQTITSCTGGLCPALPKTVFGLELTGFSLFTQPILTDETQLISTAASGSCPSTTWNGVFTFASWDSGTTNNVNLPTQPVFGTFSWNPTLNRLTIASMYNLSNYTAIPGFTPAVLNGSACSNGLVTIAGAGDQGGLLHINARDTALFRTNGNKSTFGVTQAGIPTQTFLAGTYSVFAYDSNASPTVKAFRFTISGSGTSGTGSTLSNIETGATTSETWAFSNIAVNTPISGVFTADLSVNGGAARRTACVTYFGGSNTMFFCAAQSGSDVTKPVNFVMRSDNAAVSAASLDTYSFASPTGKAVSTLAGYPGNAKANGVAIQSDGRIFVGGQGPTVDTDYFLARFLATGVKDNTFSGDGVEAQNFGGPTDDIAAVTVDSNGKSVVVGNQAVGSGAMIIARNNVAGGFDATFGGYAIVSTGLPHTGLSGTAVALQSDGKVVAVGTNGTGATQKMAIVRLRSNGAFDTDFAVDGRDAYGTSATGVNQAYAVALQSDGKIVLGGAMGTVSSGYDFGVIRVLSNGTIDTSFSTDGGASVSVAAGAGDDIGYGIAMTAESKIIQGGRCGTSACLVRWNSDGTLDTTFATAGKSVVDLGGGDSTIRAIAIQTNSRIVGAGSANAIGDWAFARWTRDGALDTSFNNTGIYVVNINGTYEQANSIALQPDGKIVAAGFSGTVANYRIYLARFWP